MQAKPGVVIAVLAWLLAGAGMLGGAWALGAKPDPLVMVLVSQAAVALPVLLLLIPLRPRELGLGAPSRKGLLAGAIVGPVALAISMAILGVIVWLFGQPPAQQPVELVIDDLRQRFGLGGLLLSAAILPGLVEETLFRGVILTGLRRHLSPAAAVLICALLFAVLHLSPWRFLPQLALGCLLGWLTLRTGSCWPAALAHALHNGLLLAGSQLVLPRP
jgi:sodium transport system permease protein